MATTLDMTLTSGQKQNEPLSIIITGGLGCIGLAITSCLSTRLPHAKIHILDLSLPNDRRIPEIKSQVEDDRFQKGVSKCYKVDVTDYSSCLEVFRAVKPRVVIHTAALIPTAVKKLGLRDESITKVNVGGTKNVLDAARTVGTEAFVLTSSCDVVKKNSWKDLVNVSEKDDDLDVNANWDEKYPETKADAERIVLAAASEQLDSSFHRQIKTCALRTQAVIGKHDNNLVPLFAGLPRRINIGPGTNLYDFTGVDNIALAHVLAVENLLGPSTTNGKAFFVTDGQPRPMRRVVEMVWAELDKADGDDAAQNSTKHRYPYWTIPVWLIYGVLYFVIPFLRLVGVASPISLNEIGDGVAHRFFDNTRAREILGYVPVVPLEQSIRDACDSYKKRTLASRLSESRCL